MTASATSFVALASLVTWAAQGRPPLDLTEKGAVARGTANATIIDTRTFHPQIAIDAPWQGKIDLVKNHLPPHSRDKRLRPAPANDLPLGGLSQRPGAIPQPTFPAIQQSAWRPPDPTLAVGPNHIVETVNMVIAFFTKDGTMTFSQNLDDTGDPGFFEDIGGGGFTFDPKCFYDHIANRFVVVALEVYDDNEPFESYITIAVSDDSDPNGVWYKYRTDSEIVIGSRTYWVDYPGFGFDEAGYYVTGNLFKLTGPGGGGFGGVLFRSFDKTPMLTGAPLSWTDLRDGSAASVQAAQHQAAPPAPFFVAVESGAEINVYAIDDPLGSPTLLSTTLTVPNFSFPSSGPPNMGGSELSVVDGRIMNVHWRDGRLYAGHTVEASGRNQARWYHFDTGDWPDSGSVTLVQSGNIDAGAGVHTWFPAIYENADADVGMVVAMSSSSTFASIQVTGRSPGDPLGTMGALSQLDIGTSGYDLGRWGDYFDITTDPLNDRTFWVVGEYATGTETWGTAIGSFHVGLVPGDTNCDGGVDAEDIDPFFLALGDAAAYEAAFPDCDIATADANGDDVVDAEDIDPFFIILGGNP